MDYYYSIGIQIRPSVVYFDQLLGAGRTQKLVELLFFSRFQAFLFKIQNNQGKTIATINDKKKSKFDKFTILIPALILRATAPNNLTGNIAHPCLKVFSFCARDFLGQQSKLIQMCKVAKPTKTFLLSDGMTVVTGKMGRGRGYKQQ